jgi:hypothetical protein
MTKRIRIAADTWTNVATAVAEVGGHVILTADADIQVGRKATAPTAGVAVAEGVGAEVIIKQGDTLVPWVYSDDAFILQIEQAGGKVVILDGAGTT